jgi:hypothetical protein
MHRVIKKHLNLLFFLLVSLVNVSCNSSGGNSAVDDFLGITNPGSTTSNGGIGNSALTTTPSTHNYGDVGVGGNGSHTFTIENTSNVSIYIFSFQGANATFSISNNTCPTTPSSFAAGATCTLDVDFDPPSGGDHSLNINVLYSQTAGNNDLVSSFSLLGSAGANAPSNYQLTAVTGVSASISWTDNSSNEVSFEVQRCNGITCASSFVSAFTNSLALNTTSYTFTGLTEGAYYRFRVRAITSSSQSDWLEGPTMLAFGGIDSIDDNGTGTNDLTFLDCRSENEGAYVTLSWNSVPDATNYFIYDKTGATSTLLKTVTAPSTSTTLTGLNINSSYDLLITAATSTGFNSQNLAETTITTTSYLPCLVLGKSSYKDQTMGTGFYLPTDVHTYGGKFFAVDRYNHRVLIWNSEPTLNSNLPNVVIGQADLTQRYINNTPGSIGTVSAKSLQFPYRVWAGSVGGTDKMVVTDTNNHRVLIWNSIPTSSHTSADVVLGQGNMTLNAANGGDTSRGMNSPVGVWSDGTKLYVTDFSNHRVLIWNTFPTSNFATPNVYLGQATSTAVGFDCTIAEGMRNPSGVWSDGTNLLVSNTSCNRVAVYNPIPTTGMTSPVTILGNSSLTGATAAATAAGVDNPYNVKMFGGRVYVADFNNHRIKVWNSLPSAGSHGVASNFVLGTSNTAATAGITSSRLQNPMSVTVSGTRIYVADYNNYRFLGYNTIPTGDDTNSNFVLGQDSFTTEVFNDSQNIAANNFDYPDGFAYDGTQFFVADSSRHRVLVWNGMPSDWNKNADFVIGQGNFSTMTAARTQSQLNTPRGICVGGGKLWVPDFSNHRVMVFDLPITTNSPNASAVLGQTSWTTATTGTGLDRTNSPIRCFYDGSKFYVVDRTYDRILIWNSLPTMASVLDNPAANIRIGDDTDNTTSQIGFRDPWGVYSDGSRLYVADSGSHRVMVWDPIPTTNDENADFHLGANADWSTRTGGVSSVALNTPVDITGDSSGNIYVLDDENGRVMVWNNPSSSNQAADNMYGKILYNDTNEPGNTSASIGDESRGLFFNENRLFIGDSIHSKVIAFPVAP